MSEVRGDVAFMHRKATTRCNGRVWEPLAAEVDGDDLQLVVPPNEVHVGNKVEHSRGG